MTSVVVLETSAQSLVPATKMNKVINLRDTNLCPDDASRKVVGSNPCASKGFFS